MGYMSLNKVIEFIYNAVVSIMSKQACTGMVFSVTYCRSVVYGHLNE